MNVTESTPLSVTDIRHITTHPGMVKVIYHPLCSMNKFVTDKSKLPQDGAQVFPYMGWLAIMSWVASMPATIMWS